MNDGPLDWLDEGPDGWTWRYLAGRPVLTAAFVFALMLLRPR